jgi:Tol biopolymer transport system component
MESAGDLAFTLELLAGRPSAAGGATPAAASAGDDAGPTVRFRPLTFRDGTVHLARYAPDGQTVVYQAAFAGEPSEIYLARLESPDSRPLGFAGADLQAVSPTAELAVTLRAKDIGGFLRLGTLARAPLVGGKPRELATDVYHADWHPDGRSLVAIRRVGAGLQLEAPLGTVIHQPVGGWMSEPRCSPDGKLIAFLDHPTPGSNGGHVAVIRPGETPRRLSELMPTISNLVWRPDGEEIWFAAQGTQGPDGVYAATLDGRVRHVYSAPGYAAVQDLTAGGDALLTMVSPRMRMETSTRSGGRAAAVDLSWLDWSLMRAISPDGSAVLFDETGIGSGETPGVYIRSIDGEPAVRLGDGVCTSISEDGRFVLAGNVGARTHFSIIPIGAGEVRRVPLPDLRTNYLDWLPGGREVILLGAREGEGYHLHRMDIESGEIRTITRRPIPPTNINASPDGAFVLTRGENGTLTVFPVDGGEPRPFEGLDTGWRAAGWWGDSRSFFIFRAGTIPTPVVRVDVATGAREPWMEIVPLERSGVEGLNAARLTRDGERYVCSYVRVNSALYHASGLR